MDVLEPDAGLVVLVVSLRENGHEKVTFFIFEVCLLGL